MGIFRRALGLAGWSALGATGYYVFWTRNCKIAEIPANDYLFNHTLYARYNPNNAPFTQDVCTRKVPLDQLRPELIEKEGKLVEAFSAGLWSGLGYAYQRRYLEKKYRGPATASQLWEQRDLQASSYEVGTAVTDHFEVVAKTADSIIFRCGDSPRVRDVRETDGLFELRADVRRDEGVAEFGLKCIFYNGLMRPDAPDAAPPMPRHVQWLHWQYDKILMETALRNCVK